MNQLSLIAIDPQNLPSPKEERWKYTDLPGALRRLTIVPAESVATQWNGPTVIDVPANEKSGKPFEIYIKAAAKGMATPHLQIRLAENAEAVVIEHHEGDGAFWNNATAEIEIGAGARLLHYRVQHYGVGAVYTQVTNVALARDAYYEAFTLTTGAGLSRNQIYLTLDGENGHCELNGVNLLRGEQVGDTTLTVHHRAPRCVSHQFYRTVVDARARGVFQGKIHVDRVAQKTDGFQMSRSLILSEGAEMDTKPELEIYADDVKCSHGATTGQLDDEALFYLRSRGIDRDAARNLLIGAFMDEAVEKISDVAVREMMAGKVRAWLAP